MQAQKSRDTQDMRFLSWVWPHVPSTSKNRTKGSMDGVVREIGYKVNRENTTNKLCKDFYT